MQYFAATEGGAPENLAGRTLVMPCVGAGNVGQLAVDLLVATLALPRVGYAEEPHVLPCVGNAPYAHAAGGTLATPLELYAAADGPVVLQMRSPAAPGTQRAFAANLAAWVTAAGFKEVLLLCSLSAQWRTEARVGLGLQLGYLSAPASHPRCEELGWAALTDVELGEEARRDALSGPWPAVEALRAAGAVTVVALVAFVTEGDNIPEAAAVAQHAQGWLGFEGLQWTMPPSWAHLYGPPPEMSLY